MAKQKMDFNNMDLGFDEIIQENEGHELVFKKVKVNQIDENPENNNIYELDEESDNFLKEDIKRNGILNPIVIIKSELHSGRYMIVSGHRRTRIAKEIGMHELEAREIIARTPEEKAFAQIMLITTNSTQRDRKPSEKAREVQYLKSLMKNNSSIENLAKWISNATKMSERNVYRYEKLAGQPKEVQEAVDKGELSVKQAIGEKPKKVANNIENDKNKAIDISKTVKHIYNLVSKINDVLKVNNGVLLDKKSKEYLKDCVKIIESVLN